MTKREYFCNLCDDRIKATADEMGKPGVGFRFEASGAIVEHPVCTAENHICDRCIQAVKELQRTF